MKSLILGLMSCVLMHSALAQISILPRPTQVLVFKGAWTLKAKAKISVTADGKRLHIVEILAEKLSKATGHTAQIVKGKGDISIAILSDDSLGEEGYRLFSTSKGATIQAPTAKDAFYGVQTLLQLLPVGGFQRYTG